MIKIGAGILISVIALLLLSAGCSSQQAFEGIKAKNKNDCYSLPESQQDKCLEATDISFDEYQRRLKEVEVSDAHQK